MSTENPPNLPAPPPDSREAMLDTLHMAYRFALDTCQAMPGPDLRRLSPEDERELGRRLAQYWSMKADRADVVSTALSMVAESDARMNTYTLAQRAALEKQGRTMALADPFTP